MLKMNPTCHPATFPHKATLACTDWKHQSAILEHSYSSPRRSRLALNRLNTRTDSWCSASSSIHTSNAERREHTMVPAELRVLRWPRCALLALSLMCADAVTAIITSDPTNGDDCGKGVDCFPCLSDTGARSHGTSTAINCNNMSVFHTGLCQSNAKGRIVATTASSAAECCGLCAGKAGCISFTWWNQTNCNLFDSVGILTPKSDCVTGVSVHCSSICLLPGHQFAFAS